MPTGRVGLIQWRQSATRTLISGQTIVDGLNSQVDGCFADANQAADRLVDLGVELPAWDAVVEGATPDHIHATPTDEPSVARGWQQYVSEGIPH